VLYKRKTLASHECDKDFATVTCSVLVVLCNTQIPRKLLFRVLRYHLRIYKDCNQTFNYTQELQKHQNTNGHRDYHDFLLIYQACKTFNKMWMKTM